VVGGWDGGVEGGGAIVVGGGGEGEGRETKQR